MSVADVRSGNAAPPVFPLWQSLHVISLTGLLSPVWIRSTGCLYAFVAKFCVGTSFVARWQKSQLTGYPPVPGRGRLVRVGRVGTVARTGWSRRTALEPGRTSLGFREWHW